MGHKRREPRRAMAILAIVAVVLAVAFVYVDGRLRPLIDSYGTQAARRSGMLAVHYGVEQVLAQQQTPYGSIVSVGRDESGRVLSAEANVSTINLLKSRVTAEIIERLQESSEQQIRVPMGNLLGGSLFVGRGPFLPFNIHTNGSVVTTLKDEFFDAGINQTCHRIYLTVSLSMTVLLPLERRHIELTTDFLVCETVLVGEVPQAYADLRLEDWPPIAQSE